MDDLVDVVLPYGKEHLTVKVPRQNLLAVVEPAEIAAAADPAAALRDAVRHPVGTPPLREMVAPGSKVVIVVDDFTRPTPAYQLLPALLGELAPEQMHLAVTILIATGTHRPMSGPEIQAKVGKAVMAEYQVVNHNARDEQSLVDLGRTRNGTPIKVNRLVMEADFVIGVGATVPHCLAGWAGGAKIIQPGVCGVETTNRTHALNMMSPTSHLGRLDNPMRMEIEEVVQRAKLHFMVNVVLNRQAEVVHVVAGQPALSHRQSVKLAEPIWVVPVPALADVVLVSSYPSDVDYWQGIKGLFAAELIVKRGGDIVLATPCPERIATEDHAAAMRAMQGVPSREQRWEAQRRGIVDLAGINTAVVAARVNELAWVSVFSQGLTVDDLAVLGHERAKTMQEGVDRALDRQGPEARIIAITHGGELCPVLRPAG